MYRWYVDFPVAFARSLRVAFGTLANEISATAYWYQAAPHPPLPPLPAPAARAYGAPLAPDAGERRLAPAQEWPLAVLGPFPAGAALPWNPEQAPDLEATYETAIGEPFQDVTGPPWPVRWQATRTRHRFVDFEAIHRAKRYLTPLGLSDRHVLPPGTGTFVLATLRGAAGRRRAARGGLRGRAGAVASTGAGSGRHPAAPAGLGQRQPAAPSASGGERARPVADHRAARELDGLGGLAAIAQARTAGRRRGSRSPPSAWPGCRRRSSAGASRGQTGRAGAGPTRRASAPPASSSRRAPGAPGSSGARRPVGATPAGAGRGRRSPARRRPAAAGASPASSGCAGGRC